MSIQFSVVRGLKWQTVNAVGRQVLSFVIFAGLARLLDPTSFGLVGIVAVYMAFVAMIADQGMSASIIQREELSPGHLHTAFWFNLTLSIGLCSLTVLFAGPIEKLLGMPGLGSLLAACSLTLVINALSFIQTTLCYRHMDFRALALRNLLGSIIGGLVGVCLALGGAGVWSLIAQQVCGSFVATVFLWLASDYRPVLSFSLARLRELFGVSISVFLTSLLWFAASRVDQIVIGRVLGPAFLGFYVIAGKVPNLLRAVCHQPLSELALPALSRLQLDHERLCRALYKGMEINALVSFPIFIGLAAVAPTLVPLLFGEQWEPSVPMMQIVSLYVLLQGLAVYFHPALLAAKCTGAYLAINTVNAVGATLAAMLLLRISVLTMVLGFIVIGMISGAITLAVLKARIGLSLRRFCQPMLGPAVAAGVMFAGVTALQQGAVMWRSLVLEVLTGVIIYGITIMVIAASRALAFFQILRQAVLGAAAVQNR